MVKTVAALIELWPSAEAFGGDIGLKWPSHARVMKLRGRIPREHWSKVVAAAEVRQLPVTKEILESVHRNEPAMAGASS